MWQKGSQKCWGKARLDRRLCLPRWPNGRSRNRPRIPQFLPWLQAHTFSTAPYVCSKCCLRKHWLKMPIWIRTGFVERQSSEFLPNLPPAPNPSVAFLLQYDVLTQRVIWQAFPLHGLSCQPWLALLLCRKAKRIFAVWPRPLWSSDTNSWARPGCCSHVHPFCPRVLDGGRDSHFDFLSGHQCTGSDVLGQKGIQEIALRNRVHFSAVQFTGMPHMKARTSTLRRSSARVFTEGFHP